MNSEIENLKKWHVLDMLEDNKYNIIHMYMNYPEHQYTVEEFEDEKLKTQMKEIGYEFVDRNERGDLQFSRDAETVWVEMA